ncbi:hypothetical protein K8Z49_25255 [Actinomadura madurae]|uniref:AfsR/SARP family transcriptional regulator n=1 Tax=Actinomadura madurae TaxID=1993 RepID=UPI00399A96E4
MEVEVKVLNQIRVTIDGTPVSLGERKQQLMAGALAVQGGTVSKATLLRLLWEAGGTPEGAGQQLYTYAKNLRQAFDRACPGARGLLVTMREQGYRLNVPRENIDYFRFLRLKSKAAAVEDDDPMEGARLGRLALSEWGAHPGVRGGTPFGGFESQLESLAETWRQEYQSALLTCLRAELACGRHEQILPELNQLAENGDCGKANQAIARMRMLAYYRCGRRPDADAVYRDLFNELRTLGNSPDVKTRELQEQIMNQDPALDLPKRATRQGTQDETAQPPTQEGSVEPSDEEQATAQAGALFHTLITGDNPRVQMFASEVDYYERSDE